MTLRIWHDNLLTAALSDTSVSQAFKPTKDTILEGITVEVYFHNDPTFTNVNLKIFTANADGTLGVLLATSTNTFTKAQIMTLNTALKNIPFAFNNLNVKKDDKYFWVLNGAGYTGTNTSYIGLTRAWPDPFYKTNVNSGYEKLGIAPFVSLMIGSEF